jgi:hypothetical protein
MKMFRKKLEKIQILKFIKKNLLFIFIIFLY